MTETRPTSRPGKAAARRLKPRPEGLEDRRLLATLTVNGTADDINSDGVLSLREAIEVVNGYFSVGDLSTQEQAQISGTPGGAAPDTIAFNIPGGGVQTIALTSALPEIKHPVTIDGYTQPGSAPNSASTGTNAVIRVALDGSAITDLSKAIGLFITAGDSTVRGLDIHDFDGAAVALSGAGGNRVIGNFLGTDATGTRALPNGMGVAVFGPRSEIGGTAAADRNLISGNGMGVGVVSLNFNSMGIPLPATGSVIQNNLIGTDASGNGALGNTLGGVLLAGPGNLVGGTAPGSRNIISHNGNQASARLGAGVTIVGIAPSTASLLANPTVGNSVLGNSISANKQLGIDLATLPVVPVISELAAMAKELSNLPANIAEFLGKLQPGPTANDPGDNDAGANQLQNYPTLTAAVANNGQTAITGTLNSTPQTAFRVEFFASPNAGPLGYGEGATFLGTTSVTTGADGNASLSFTPTIAVPKGQYVTATATDPDGNTSEFSLAIPVTEPPPPPPPPSADLQLTKSGLPDTITVGQSLVYVLVVTNAGPNRATNVALTDPLPNGVDFVSSSVGTYDEASRTLTAGLGALDSGRSRTITVVVRTTAAGILTNTAQVNGDQQDPEPGNNRVSASTTVVMTPASAQADLGITQSSTPSTVLVGGDLTYTLTISNAGPQVANGVLVTDTLPAGVDYVSATASQGSASMANGDVTATLGTLAVGDSATVTIVVRPRREAAGTVTNVATVVSDVSDRAPANNVSSATATVKPIVSDLSGDFNGDGITDLAVYVPAGTTGTGHFEIQGQGGETLTIPLGGPGVIPVTGDFDGDGLTDVAVVDPNARMGGSTTPNATIWSIIFSSAGFAPSSRLDVPFGAAGSLDRPAPADFDGDGITDIATFRASSDLMPNAAQWFILPSKPNPGFKTTTGAYSVLFGAAGGVDLPAPFDFDGDGKADIATFRPVSDLMANAAQWFILPSKPNPGFKSNSGAYSVIFGAAGNTDQPVVADYNGDGRADIATFRSTSDLVAGRAQWFILPSVGAAPQYGNGDLVTFGQAGEIAAPGDYDGDGKADLVVFNADSGTWTIRSSSTGQDRTVGFGTAGVNAVPVTAPLYFRLLATGNPTSVAPASTSSTATGPMVGTAAQKSADPALALFDYGVNAASCAAAASITPDRHGELVDLALEGLDDPELS